MAERFKLKQANALKHGLYSTLGLLPGESPASFKKHQKAVIDEFRPHGPVEHAEMRIPGIADRRSD
jgi:hypothetical protein